MSFSKLILTISCIGIFTAMIIPTYAQNTKAPITNNAQQVTMKPITIPTEFTQSTSREVTVDKTKVTLTRYERKDGLNSGLGGEHISSVYDTNGVLKGFTYMDSRLAEGELVSKDEARAIAVDFLHQYAPDLLANYNESWIAPHDETITESGNKVTLTGMKVKMRNLNDKRWFWVIVAKDKSVMVFERDIVWVTIPGHRQTEQWLHDSWLAKQAK